MEKFCHKESSRVCDEKCQAFCIDPRHGTNCLELATSAEAVKRMPEIESSLEIAAFYMKALSTIGAGIQDSIQKASKFT